MVGAGDYSHDRFGQKEVHAARVAHFLYRERRQRADSAGDLDHLRRRQSSKQLS